MTIKVYRIDPVAKPRMTQSDKWKKRPATTKYWAFKDKVEELGITLSSSGSHVTFHVPVPKSWSKKKQKEFIGQPHIQRPDVDNYVKSLMDAIYEDESHIWDIRITKVWSRVGMITIEEK